MTALTIGRVVREAGIGMYTGRCPECHRLLDCSGRLRS